MKGRATVGGALFVAASALAGPADVVPVDPALQRLIAPMPAPTADAVRADRWDTALVGLKAARPSDSATDEAKAAWAFQVGWVAVNTEHPEAAADVVGRIGADGPAPATWAALVRGEIALAGGDHEAALKELAQVPAESAVGARAAMTAHRALLALGRKDEAWARLEALVARPDPAPGNAEALFALAGRAGPSADASRDFVVRIRTFYPGTPEDKAVVSVGGDLTWKQKARRAEALTSAGAWQAAIDLTEGVQIPEADRGTEDACRLRYARGRAQTRVNAQTAAATTLAGVAKVCAGATGDYGAKGGYLLAQALHRKKAYAEAAAAYQALAEHYPTSNLADDGLTRAGASLLEVGKASEARALFERATTEFPAGDTVPEALLRLSLDRYAAGDPADAIAVAERLATLPLEGDALRVAGGKYWAARFRMYPSASDPRAPTKNADDRAAAIAGWKALCEQHPHSYYAILAAARLYELAPDVITGISRPAGHDRGEVPVAWDVRASTLRDAHVRDAVALFRLGLPDEGRSELALADVGEWTVDERAWLAGLRTEGGDWLFAHDELRRWAVTHPIGTMGAHEARVARIVYPDRYWTEVKGAVKADWHYEPRLFHALVREESSFNREVVSFAGAYGLSQLMPATAQQTAGWLGMKVTNKDLVDPVVNLTIGARYLEAMHTQLGRSPFLALAAYNGGAGNVNKWLAAKGNLPTDEFVEGIPFDETRGYVTRVMGTWQVYRYRYDDGAPFPDLSAFNHTAKP